MSKHATIGLDDVRHMAQLSRILVSDDEKRLFAEQFEAILDYMDVLQDVDVTGVEPLYSPVCHAFKAREDTAERVRTHEEILRNAPEADEQYFIVPRIV
ncbi:MAG: Asp-tRNA(Asn)/Glu-tRNA(Gln) amidotransferase subunit GatC [Desulfovibrio sp.]|nr:Asp-tRNA(Asn)/Glu-tRNA(Gln) amidotransferase subunit GatC [Desulfovibrio sp.]